VIYVIYLNDILIFSKRAEEHTTAVYKVLKRLRTYNLYINLKKCRFNVKEVEFLGFIINPDRVEIDRGRVDTITQWPIPGSFCDVQVFLGFANFYRRFIKAYSRVARGLTDLLKGSVKGKKPGRLEMTPEALEAFAALKRAFTKAPILRHFDPVLQIMVKTDVSDFVMSGILSQLFGTGAEAR